MTTECLFSWAVGKGVELRGGKSSGLSWDETSYLINEVWNKSGSLTIDLMGGSDIGPRNIQILAENNNAIITMGVNTEDDYIVRSYSSGNSGRKIEILGDIWDSEFVCENYSVVLIILKEFFYTGDVSLSLLS